MLAIGTVTVTDKKESVSFAKSFTIVGVLEKVVITIVTVLVRLV